jgi:hypothetical protein
MRPQKDDNTYRAPDLSFSVMDLITITPSMRVEQRIELKHKHNEPASFIRIKGFIIVFWA